MQSNAFSLNKQDVIDCLHQFVVWYGPVILLVMNQLQSGTFSWNSISALALSITTDLVIRYVKWETSPVIPETTVIPAETSVTPI